MEKNWAELTREEKRQERLKNFLNPPDIKFRDARAGQYYKERSNRFLKVWMCEEPDRVPVNLPTAHYPAYYAGFNLKKVLYDYKAMRAAWKKFVEDFYEDMDTCMGPGFVSAGKVMDILDFKNYAWPGHNLGDDTAVFQFIEAAYMKPDEYDMLMQDPSDFGFRMMAPRTIGAAAALQNFPPLNSLFSMPTGITYTFTRKDVRETFRKFIEAGEELEKWNNELAVVRREMLEAGFPEVHGGGMGIAPFDVIADFLRGTGGTAIDMFRQPEKLLECIDMITELQIPRMIKQVNAIGGFNVSFPLHKGDDTFMSRKQFEKFYWPTLKKCIDALIEEGIMVALFAEGAYNQRLEYIGDFPKGWVTWTFDKTDMGNAKKMIGSRCCITGNVPGSVMVTGTPKEVKEYCRRLIEACAPGGGYILDGGCPSSETKNPENFRAFMQAAKEYGMYK
jgi:hypothetical protein